ncbi:PREDICTED: uncharacterized protein LOC106813383 [Priapulus caudatus]|uniref:Uncharacterized protein LOC106813383 n=1 Tax=Priapulus caudatus TaxID=37621 RepID=A0ABM1ELD2_PRICU|nr:PREDICTED: uncharacterized protein LOC106813383 [Priapulus caudatus]
MHYKRMSLLVPLVCDSVCWGQVKCLLEQLKIVEGLDTFLETLTSILNLTTEDNNNADAGDWKKSVIDGWQMFWNEASIEEVEIFLNKILPVIANFAAMLDILVPPTGLQYHLQYEGNPY